MRLEDFTDFADVEGDGMGFRVIDADGALFPRHRVVFCDGPNVLGAGGKLVRHDDVLRIDVAASGPRFPTSVRMY